MTWSGRNARRSPSASPALRHTAWLVIVSVSLLAPGACSRDLDPVGPTVDDFPDEPAPTLQPSVVAFVDVTVVPMDAERTLDGRTVIVRGDRIEAVGPTPEVAVPEGAFVVQGRGRYLMPALADMHVHVTSKTFAYLRNDFFLWLANGVTTLRVMWGSRGALDERDRIRAGEVVGPDMVVASPGLDGPGGTWTGGTPPVATPEEARTRVKEHAATGYDFIKVYNDLALDVYEAIVDEARAHGMPVVGHVPGRVGIERVQDARQLTLEHFIGFKLRASTPFTGGDLDMERVRSLAARSAARGVWHTPTITVDALSVDEVAAIRSSRALRLTSPGMRAFFESGFHNGIAADVARRERRNHELMTAAVHDAGAGILLGTDAGFGWILPGFSIHDELLGLAGSGLTPFQAIAAGTSGAARSLGMEDEFGRVAPGLRADLLLVVRNPLRDVANVRETSGVMVRGRWLSRGTLEAELDRIETTYVTEGLEAPSSTVPDPALAAAR